MISKKSFILLIFSLLLLPFVNAEILNEYCSQVNDSNSFYQTCNPDPIYMKDLEGEWRNFSDIVKIKWLDEVKTFLVSWNNKNFSILPFVIINNRKFYIKDVDQRINLNFQPKIREAAGSYKFSYRLNNVAGLQSVGFDVRAANRLTPEIFRGFYKFGDLGIDVNDLLESFDLASDLRDDDFGIRTQTNSFDSAIIDFDPSISQSNSNVVRAVGRWTYLPPFVPPITARCSVQYFTAGWDLVPYSQGINRKGAAEFHPILDQNIVIYNVEFRSGAFSNNLPIGQDVELKRMTQTLWSYNCYDLFNAIANGDEYTSVTHNFFPVGSYSKWKDLGVLAVEQLRSDPSLFVIGAEVETIDLQSESWDGEVDLQIQSSSFAPQIRITYRYIKTVIPEVSKVKKDYLPYYLGFGGLFLILILVLIIARRKKNKGDGVNGIGAREGEGCLLL